MIKVFFIEKFSEGNVDLQLEAMRKYMHFVDLNDADVILCASIVFMHKALAARNQTGKPLAVYCWDYYKWVHDGKTNGGNAWHWPEYARMLQMADLVMVPSEAQQRRLRELLGVPSVIVRTGIRKWTDTYPQLIPTDDNFILDPIRYYPEDNKTWAEEAAAKLGIPIIHSEHRYTDEEYGKLIASCTFTTCAFKEASTGTLTISEALWFGKKTLLADSEYQGGWSYMRPYAVGFKEDDFDAYCTVMKKMWEERPTVPLPEARAYFEREFSFDRMAQEMQAALRATMRKER